MGHLRRQRLTDHGERLLGVAERVQGRDAARVHTCARASGLLQGRAGAREPMRAEAPRLPLQRVRAPLQRRCVATLQRVDQACATLRASNPLRMAAARAATCMGLDT